MVKKSRQAFAYTPGLKIKETMVVRKERRLPIKGRVLVSEGDSVEFSSRVAETSVLGDPNIIDVATLWGVLPDTVKECMLKPVGSVVAKGECIATYSSFFGLFKKNLECPIDGTIENVSTITGRCTIRAAPIPVYCDAYIPGKVERIIEGEGIVVNTVGAFIQGIFGVGGETHGVIRVPVTGPGEHLTPEKLTPDMRGCIVIAGSLVTSDLLKKAVEVGVSGIIAGGMNSSDLIRFMGAEIGVAITGEEKLGLTLIITEGFGEMSMHTKTFNILKKFEGLCASMSGETQIRAGVIRPEVIIPHKGVEGAGESVSDGMIKGTPIRVIREPYFGAIGRVVSLPVELRMMESGSYVRVLEAELEGGERVIVPRANVEILEE